MNITRVDIGRRDDLNGRMFVTAYGPFDKPLGFRKTKGDLDKVFGNPKYSVICDLKDDPGSYIYTAIIEIGEEKND